MAQGKANPSSNEYGQHASERSPLLQRRSDGSENDSGTSTTSEADDDWDAPENSRNPRNWKTWFRWATVALVAFIECLSSMPNFMYAPNITEAQEDLKTSNTELATFSLTIYVLGFSFGPILFAPLSELYGRVPVYRYCLTAFLLMTAGCGLSPNVETLVVFRFLAGTFGAAPVAIGGAVVGDLFPVKERGTAMSVYQAGQIIASIIGPPVGGLIGAYLLWRWVFWIVCILTGLALICTFLVLYETHAPTLKRRIYGASEQEKRQSLGTALGQALTRPLKLLVKSPVVAAGCLLIFVVIGLLNLFLTELSRTVQTLYGVSSGQSGLMYVGMALGFGSATVLFGSTNDKIMHAFARWRKTELLPEYRLPPTMAAMPFVVAGMLMYGWTLQMRVHWAWPIAGSGIAGFGMTTTQLSVITYIIDSFDEYSASALAAVTVARSVGGAILPLVGPFVYQNLDQGWGNSVLALIALVCSAVPVLMYVYGARWRAMFSTDDL